MKKLSLGKLKLDSEEVLQRSQLATIYGGSGGQGHTCYCRDKEATTSKTVVASTTEEALDAMYPPCTHENPPHCS